VRVCVEHGRGASCVQPRLPLPLLVTGGAIRDSFLDVP